MKQITYVDVCRLPDRVGPFIGLITIAGEKHVLKYESHFDEHGWGGWIFRRVGNNRYGHSGPHKRRDDACELAMSVQGTVVYEFESQAALDVWAHEGEITYEHGKDDVRRIKLSGNMIEIPINNPMGDE